MFNEREQLAINLENSPDEGEAFLAIVWRGIAAQLLAQGISPCVYTQGSYRATGLAYLK